MARTAPGEPAARSAREAELYDEGTVWDNSNRWNERFPHIFQSPNTALGERRFRSLVSARIGEARALDVGCGRGTLTRELRMMGAGSVYGFDISQREVELARQENGDLDGVEFGVHDAQAPLDGHFDLIVGRSILHHIDFHDVLVGFFARNLTPGGRMVFMEPMSHPMTVFFHRLVPSAHTPDERPLTRSDAAWLEARLAARIVPVNFVSFPAGAISSLLMRSADNALTRLADRIDRSLEHRPAMRAHGRQGIIVIDRPAG